jgi:hypothetical protein
LRERSTSRTQDSVRRVDVVFVVVTVVIVVAVVVVVVFIADCEACTKT